MLIRILGQFISFLLVTGPSSLKYSDKILGVIQHTNQLVLEIDLTPYH